MCTLVAQIAPEGTYPLVVAANRDERLARPAGPPRIWRRPGAVDFLAPVDEQAGGTWLGLNANGLFVGVTNRFGEVRRPERASRGALVTYALEQQSAEALHRWLGALAPDVYNAFHLFYADRRGAFMTWTDGGALHQRVLEPGLHVVTERSLGGDDRARTERVRAGWDAAFGPEPAEGFSEAERVRRLAALLGGHDEADPMTGPCIHLPELGYGTRSASIVLLGSAGKEARFFWAEGRPCETPFRDLGPLVEQLSRAAGL